MLEYIKVNNKEFIFNKGLNIISTNPDSNKVNGIGKTSFINLLQFIFGKRKKRPVTINIQNRLFSHDVSLLIVWRFHIKGIHYQFTYSSNDSDVVMYDDNNITFDEYREMICEILENKVKVIAEHFNKDYLFIRKSTENIKLSDTFQYRSATYIALFLLKILFYDDDYIARIKRIEEYYQEVAKRNSYRNIRGKYYKDLIDELETTDLFEIETEIRGLKKKLNKLNRMQTDDPDVRIVAEIKSLDLGLDIDKIQNFHDQVVSDYNEIVNEEKISLEEKIKLLEAKIANSIVLDYDQLDINIAAEITEYMKDRLIDLQRKFITVEDDIDVMIEKGSDKIKLSEEAYNKLFNNDDSKSTATNQFSKPPLRNGILESLRFTQGVSNSGSANDGINRLILNSVILAKSSINIVAVDTLHFAEIKDKISDVLDTIIKIIGEKQYVIMLFGDQLNTSKFSAYIKQTLGSGHDTLFGIDF